LSAAEAMLRLRDCEPVPHDLVQVVQALKAEVAQWIGHGPWLHARVSALCGQAAPPNCGATLVRERLWTPVPHDLVQVVQALKAPTPQSTGHAAALQLRVSALCGHARPPNCGCVLARERLWAPMPHDLVQAVQASTRATTQSAAQGWALQARVSTRYGHT
jgi:hypothetical protein